MGMGRIFLILPVRMKQNPTRRVNENMIAKGSGYVRGNRQAATARLTSHFKYTEHRSKDLERETRDGRRIFSKDQDVVSRKDAVDDVMEHTSTSVNYHKIVLSPGQDEPIQDWREWTRDVMHDLEERQGHALYWYAVKHDNTDNPHDQVSWVYPAQDINQEKYQYHLY
jgi:hypothetical protein